jgi:hypothetical protein
MPQTGNQPAAVATSQTFARPQSSFGVVACATFGFWALCGALVGVTFAFRTTPVMALIADGGITITYLVYLGSALAFAYKHREAVTRISQ